MDEQTLNAIQKSYDGIADEYARHLYSELDNKPLDRELLARFAARVKDKGAICDMGCGPGHIARFLHDAGTNVFGLDLSSRMIEEARRLNPEISFRQGNMLALDSRRVAGRHRRLLCNRQSSQSIPAPGSFARWRAS
jgi:2-polyprenyl-3-methyl-5-hydroxy-6-metoxy-1,4-benzoquinol methylase